MAYRVKTLCIAPPPPGCFTHCEQVSKIKKLATICETEVLTAVTMKNVVIWDIKTQFVLHRRHITSPLQSPAS
jgi:hypothetical protein